MAIGYRHTKTYIAASFDHDRDAVEKLYEWNKDNKLSFHFVDVHSLTKSYDSSRYCSIKKSLSDRMSVSKTFILIVGQHTNEVTKGACYNNGCGGYVRLLLSNPYCRYGYSINNKSYIQYECDLAIRENAKIVVLYKSVNVERNLFPEAVRYRGTHIAMKCRKNTIYGSYIDWDYQAVKNAVMD